jgi:hypothetical protein
MKLEKNTELLRQTTLNTFNSYFQEICFPIVKISSSGTQNKGLDSRSGLGHLDSRSGLGSSQTSSAPKGMTGFSKGNNLDMNFKSNTLNDANSSSNNMIISNNDNNGSLGIGCYYVLRQIQRATKCLQNLSLFQGKSLSFFDIYAIIFIISVVFVVIFLICRHCCFHNQYHSYYLCGYFSLLMPYWLVYVLHVEDRFFNTLRL